MGIANRSDEITRRGFLEFSSAALAAAGLLGEAKTASAAPDTGGTQTDEHMEAAALAKPRGAEGKFSCAERRK